MLDPLCYSVELPYRAALRALVAGGTFELRYQDLDEAVTRLESLLSS